MGGDTFTDYNLSSGADIGKLSQLCVDCRMSIGKTDTCATFVRLSFRSSTLFELHMHRTEIEYLELNISWKPGIQYTYSSNCHSNSGQKLRDLQIIRVREFIITHSVSTI